MDVEPAVPISPSVRRTSIYRNGIQIAGVVEEVTDGSGGKDLSKREFNDQAPEQTLDLLDLNLVKAKKKDYVPFSFAEEKVKEVSTDMFLMKVVLIFLLLFSFLILITIIGTI